MEKIRENEKKCCEKEIRDFILFDKIDFFCGWCGSHNVMFTSKNNKTSKCRCEHCNRLNILD